MKGKKRPSEDLGLPLRYEQPDSLAPARGCLFGAAVALMFWAVVAGVLWWWFR